MRLLNRVADIWYCCILMVKLLLYTSCDRSFLTANILTCHRGTGETNASNKQHIFISKQSHWVRIQNTGTLFLMLSTAPVLPWSDMLKCLSKRTVSPVRTNMVDNGQEEQAMVVSGLLLTENFQRKKERGLDEVLKTAWTWNLCFAFVIAPVAAVVVLSSSVSSLSNWPLFRSTWLSTESELVCPQGSRHTTGYLSMFNIHSLKSVQPGCSLSRLDHF